MIQVLNIAAECYPAAKTGGLGDVVGSLPKYLTEAGVLTAAVIPKYALKWIHQQEWITVHGGSVRVDWRNVGFTVQQMRHETLGFPLFVVDIPGLYDRPGIYNDPSGAPYGDELERYLCFQQAVLKWVMSFPETERPKVLHCHDHHTALIPWMVQFCPEYRALADMPTVFTIHNGQYQGWFTWVHGGHLLPFYEGWSAGFLDWKGVINPMAAAIKCAWAVTTVSESYLYELHEKSLGLESLFHQEWRKQYGIINGIDAKVWDPATDPMIQHKLEGNEIADFKAKNKQVLCEWFGLSPHLPIISFIGRMVSEKGSDILPDTFRRFLHQGGRANFLVLGTGETWTQDQFRNMAWQYPGRFNAVIDYNEALSHQIYAGSDFLIMPSRVEPCGLNQMYAMRYGAIPIVRSVGGLKDTVPDIGQEDGQGRGIRFDHFSTDDCYYALHRATSMYHNDPGVVAWLRGRIMGLDFSWEKTVGKYIQAYQNIGAKVAPLEKAKVQSANGKVQKVSEDRQAALVKEEPAKPGLGRASKKEQSRPSAPGQSKSKSKR